MKSSVLLLSFVVGAIRPMLIFVTLNEHLQSTYEAVAHLLVGGLFAWYFAKREVWKRSGSVALRNYDWTFLTAASLTLVEIVCAGTMLIR